MESRRHRTGRAGSYGFVKTTTSIVHAEGVRTLPRPRQSSDRSPLAFLPSHK